MWKPKCLPGFPSPRPSWDFMTFPNIPGYPFFRAPLRGFYSTWGTRGVPLFWEMPTWRGLQQKSTDGFEAPVAFLGPSAVGPPRRGLHGLLLCKLRGPHEVLSLGDRAELFGSTS